MKNIVAEENIVMEKNCEFFFNKWHKVKLSRTEINFNYYSLLRCNKDDLMPA